MPSFITSKKLRQRTLRALLLTAIVATIYHIAIAATTERWRVFANDYLHFIATLVALPVVAISAVAFTYSRWAIIGLALLLPLFSWSHDRIVVQRLKDATASCANHSSFTGKMFSASELPSVLTNSIEFADYLEQLYAGQTQRPSMLCPGYKWTKTKTGIAFVGAGLDHRKLPAEDVLIAFCFADSHPIPFDHQRFIFFQANRDINDPEDLVIGRSCARTSEMTNLLTIALKQAREGKVPYTQAAQKLLSTELELRIENLRNPPFPHSLTNSAKPTAIERFFLE